MKTKQLTKKKTVNPINEFDLEALDAKEKNFIAKIKNATIKDKKSILKDIRQSIRVIPHMPDKFFNEIVAEPVDYVFKPRGGNHNLNYPRTTRKATKSGNFVLGLGLGKTNLQRPNLDFGYDNDALNRTSVSSSISYNFRIEPDRSYNISSIFACLIPDQAIQFITSNVKSQLPVVLDPGGYLLGKVTMKVLIDGLLVDRVTKHFLEWYKSSFFELDEKVMNNIFELSKEVDNTNGTLLTVVFTTELMACDTTNLRKGIPPNEISVEQFLADTYVYIGCDFTDAPIHRIDDFEKVRYIFDENGQPLDIIQGSLTINNVQLNEL